MSPEQALGEKLDARTDLFSFGAALYEMATGRLAFCGTATAAIHDAILHKVPASPSRLNTELPAELERIINKALEKDREIRYQHASDLRADLKRLKRDTGSGRSAGVSETATAWAARRRRWVTNRWIWIAAILGLALVIGGVARFRSAHVTPHQGEAALVGLPLTGNSGRESHPALSPDGNAVAYAWDGAKGGNAHIYVKLIGAGPPLRLTNDPVGDSSPTWSPDGRYIAFCRQSSTETGILIVPALGGPERKLGESIARDQPWMDVTLAWSPNGKFLAIVDKNSPQDPHSIFLVSTETGEKRKLTSPPAGNTGDAYPAFSPDGQTLAFVRFYFWHASDVYVLPIADDGKPKDEPKRLTFNEGSGQPDWTPDGREIVFESNGGLGRILASGGRPSLVLVGRDGSSPSVSRRGRRLAYTRGFDNSNIWRMRMPGATGPAAAASSSRSNQERNVATILISSTRGNLSPEYSPDGKRIVFISSRTGTDEVWVCDSEGFNPVQLTSLGETGSPQWSPDSQRIAFDSPKEGHSEIYVVNADGGSLRRLTTGNAPSVRPVWSRDGRWIYFGSKRSGTYEVWKMPSEGGTPIQVTRRGGKQAFESPDGKFIYYGKEQEPGIWRVPVEGGDEIRVIDHANLNGLAVLNQGIYLLNSGTMPLPAIEFFSFTRPPMARVAVLPREVLPILNSGDTLYSISPDGRWIIYARVDRSESDIELVENFR